MNMRGFMRDLKTMRRRGSKAADRVARKWKDVGGQFQRVGGMLTAGVTLPIVGAGALALKTAADYESLRVSMDVLNKSVKEGGRNFKRLKEFSARTPFQLKDLARAQNMLQGFGLSADDAFDSMKMIGDIAAVASGDIQGIGIAFGQAAAEGRLMTRDIRQLINQGVPAITLLADTMGVAKSEILDLASEGKISFEILQEAFKDATSEGGMFADGMKKQAQTLSGVFSTMKDNVSLALGDMGSILGKVAKPFMKTVIEMAKSFRELDRGTKIAIASVSTFAAAIGPLSFAIGSLIKAMPLLISGFTKLNATVLANPYVAMGAAIATIATVAYKAWNNTKKLNSEVRSLVNTDVDTKSWHQLEDRVVRIKGTIKKINELQKNSPSGFGGAGQLERLKKMRSELEKAKKALSERMPKGILKTPAMMMEDAGASVIENVLGSQGQGPFLVQPKVNVKPDVDKGGMAKNVQEIFTNLKGQFEQFKVQASLDDLFPNFDLLAEKTSAVKSAMVQLIEAGVSPTSAAFKRLLEMAPTSLMAIRRAAENVTNPIQKVGFKMQQLKPQFSQLAIKGQEGMSLIEAATGKTKDKVNDLSRAGVQMGQMIGQAFSQAVLHGKNLMDIVTNLIKQMASQIFVQGIMALLTGGSSLAAGSIGSAIFGGLFHGGGMVPGSGERMIRAKGGEMVLTASQQRALGGMMGGGQMTINPRAIGSEIGKQLDRRLQKLSNGEIYAMAQKGRRGF